ncbi:MAG: hypothetical protein ACRCZG_06345, partial [Culicoidibacterales bacterium]
MNQNIKNNYEQYKTIIEIQLSKLHISYNIEDFTQEAWLTLITAEEMYEAFKCPKEYKIAYLTKKVNWHLKSLLRHANYLDKQDQAYRRYYQNQHHQQSNEYYWREIQDSKWQMIIKMLGEGYSKQEIAILLGVDERTVQRYCNKLREMSQKF